MATAVNEKIQNLVVIEDKFKLARQLKKLHLLNYPVDIQAAEDWEDFLDARGLKYLLAQCEVWVEGAFRAGYCIFTQTAVGEYK